MPMTSEGYRPRTTNEWLTRLKTAFESRLSQIGKAPPRWLPHEFVNVTFNVVTFAISEIDEMVAAAQQARSLTNAAGTYLRELADLVGVRIDPGTPSTVELTVGAWSNGDVLLSKGSKAGSLDGSTEWVTTDDVTIPSGSTATITAKCTKMGPTTAAANTITRRLSGVAGWVSVTNADPATPGTNADENVDVRKRISRGTFAAGSRSPLAMKDNLENVSGVKKAIVYNNKNTTAVTVSGRTVPACGWGVWIWPSSIDTAARQEALARVYAFKDGSVPTSYPTATGADGVRGAVIGADGLVNDIGYWWVRDHAFKIKVTITSYEGTATLASVTNAVKAAVENYFAFLTPGDTVRQNDLVGAVAAVTGVGRATVELSEQDNPGTDPGADTWDAYSTADRTIDAADIALAYLTTVL